MNVSLRGLTERLCHGRAPYAGVMEIPGVAQPAWLLLALGVAIVTAWRTWPERARPADVDRAFAGLLVAALLISPLGWIYYLPLITGPVLALAVRGELTGPRAGWTAVLVAALAWLYVPMEITEAGQPSRLATLVLASAHGWGSLLLWAALLARPAIVVAPSGDVAA